MSWFDTSGFANIAKSALKEAQRTIDKALDIKDDEPSAQEAPGESPVDTNSDDFFGTWGVSPPQGSNDDKSAPERVHPKAGALKVGSSLWGSFTGSFFDAAQGKDAAGTVDFLDDSIDPGHEPFSGSKLVVQGSDEIDIIGTGVLVDLEEEVRRKSLEDSEDFLEEIPLNSDVAHVDRSASYTNRLSVVSCESDKKSSESVEILGNHGSSSFTTTPDSEMLSHSVSFTSSAQGSKLTSESVEVLMLNSVTSPSSIEVLALDSRRQSQYTDEFVSPLESPGEILGFPGEKRHRLDSVEVIDDDNTTISYNSLSECTTTAIQTTPQPLHKPPPPPPPDTSNNPIITRAPTRVLAPLIDVQPHLASGAAAATILSTSSSNVIDIPEDGFGFGSMQESDSSSQSERTLTTGEQSMVESGSDDASTTTDGTSQLKVMLAEAMCDKVGQSQQQFGGSGSGSVTAGMDTISLSTSEGELVPEPEHEPAPPPPRDTSPLSSDSRSDLVKIGSDHTSGHTSGDDLETTTSSDIEIISSPNGGDSSSTHSRHSPAKATLALSAGVGVGTAGNGNGNGNGNGGNGRGSHCKSDANVDTLLEKMTFKKIRGHTRELSAASSISDDCEIERLIKRISEMTEILEIRETKLVEINRRNTELSEINSELNRQLDQQLNQQVEKQENVSIVTEEYTQRMSVLERKFQQVIREKDSLRKQLDQSKQDAATRLSKGEMDTVLSEKEDTIKELREEGEKLSKLQLQHSNIIKKLRAKEKEHETSIKHLKESVEDLSSETERLKRSLAAKEEVERSQIEAVHLLTSKNKKQEHDINLLQSQVDDLTQKYDTTKKSLEAAKKELIDKNRTSNELAHRENLLHNLEQEKRMTESQNEEIISQIEDLRTKLRQSDSEISKKETVLRAENNELMRRLEEAESRNEELTQSMLETTKPLVRQLESLQAVHNVKLTNFEEVEQNLLTKINDLQGRLQSALDSEKVMKDDCVSSKSKLSLVESQLKTNLVETDMLRSQFEQEKTLKTMLEQELNSKLEMTEESLRSERQVVDDLKKESLFLKENLLTERNQVETQKRKLSTVLQDRQQERHSPLDGSISPTISIGRISISESINSSLWQNDDPHYESTTPTLTNPAVRCTNMLEMQTLQTNLKQRDGDLQQLQWELSRRENERTLLNDEIAALLSRVETLEGQTKGMDGLRAEHGDMKREYETLCQLYGEKVEETEELRLDLKEVKEMYKLQLEELLAKHS